MKTRYTRSAQTAILLLAATLFAAHEAVGFPIPLPQAEVAGVVQYPNGDAAPGVLVTLSRKGRLVASTTTGADGRYGFPNLMPGAYTVAANPGTSVSFNVGSFAIYIPLTTSITPTLR